MRFRAYFPHFFVKILHKLPQKVHFHRTSEKYIFTGINFRENSKATLPKIPSYKFHTRYQCPKKQHNFRGRGHALFTNCVSWYCLNFSTICWLFQPFVGFFNHLLAFSTICWLFQPFVGFSLIIIFSDRGRKKVAKFFAFSSDKTFVIWPKFRQFEIRVKEKDQYLRSQNLAMFRHPEFIWIPQPRLSIF